jgi:hypothetical protein
MKSNALVARKKEERNSQQNVTSPQFLLPQLQLRTNELAAEKEPGNLLENHFQQVKKLAQATISKCSALLSS